MPRKRPETKRSKIAKMLIEEYQPQSAQDIQEELKDLLGDTMEELLKEEWQNRPLEKIYPMVFLDAIHYHVRENNIVVKKAVYIALGYNLEGFKEILGMWVGENETSKYWLLVLIQLKERGVEDILIISTDNLPGFSQAIEAVYPKAEIQKCIIHQIRSSTKYVSYKNIKELIKELKAVYKAATEELALTNLGIFEEKWDKKYPMCVNSWKNNWANYQHILNIQKEYEN